MFSLFVLLTRAGRTDSENRKSGMTLEFLGCGPSAAETFPKEEIAKRGISHGYELRKGHSFYVETWQKMYFMDGLSNMA